MLYNGTANLLRRHLLHRLGVDGYRLPSRRKLLPTSCAHRRRLLPVVPPGLLQWRLHHPRGVCIPRLPCRFDMLQRAQTDR